MTEAEMYTLLTSITGFTNKVVHFAWPEGQAPTLPFICFFVPNIKGFAADGVNYHNKNHFQIEFYSKTKDVTNESLLETTFTNNGLYYTKTSIFLSDEKCWETIYEIEV